MPGPVKVHFQLIQDEDGYPPVAVESVWAQAADGPNRYVLDSVPFFAREATLGDVVAVHEQDGSLWFRRLTKPSGNSLIRVVFFDRNYVDGVRRHLETLGCSAEYLRRHHVLSVNVPIIVKLREVQDYLRQEADADHIDYEEAILRQ